MPDWIRTERQRVAAWAVFAFVLEILFVCLFRPDQPFSPDYTPYNAMTDQLAAGRGFTENGQAFIFFPPGFVFYLYPFHRLADWLLVPRYEVVIWGSIPFGVANTLLVREFTRRLFGGSIAEWTTFLWASYPFQLYLFVQPSSEIPFLTFFLLSLVLIARRPKSIGPAVLAGLFLGLSCLVRPITLYLSLLLALFIGITASPRGAVCFLLAFGLTLLPWEYYVYALNGEWIPVQGKSILVVREGLLFGHPSYAGTPVPVPEDVFRLMDRLSKTDYSFGSLWEALGQSEPLPLIKLLGIKLVRCWYGLWSGSRETLTALVQGLILLPAVIGFFRYAAKGERGSVLCLILIFFFWGTTFLIIPMLRYMIPAMPFVLIFTAMTLKAVCRKFQII